MAPIEQAPPGPDESKAGLVVGVICVVQVISLLLCGARIWTRVVPSFRLSLDDYLIVLSSALELLSASFILVAVHYGVGRHNYHVPDDQEVLAAKWLFHSQPPVPWSLACSKVSIAWMTRIHRESRWWTWGMYLLIVISILVAITSTVFQLLTCQPIAANWDHSIPGAECTTKGQIAIYVTSSLTIATDFALSLAPLSFIIHIQRPLREKIVLGFVMGLGIFISSVSIAKTFMVSSYGKTGDTLMDTVGLATLSNLELQLAIIAACIPVLKRPFETVLRRWGLLSAQGVGSAATRSHTGYVKHDGSSRPRHYSQTLDSHNLATLRQRDAKNRVITNIDIDTDSLESGETPIMKQPGRTGQDSGSSEASLAGRDYEPAAPSPARTDKTVFFKTDIMGGDRGHGGNAGNANADGIQIETTVPVHTEIKPHRRDGSQDAV